MLIDAYWCCIEITCVSQQQLDDLNLSTAARQKHHAHLSTRLTQLTYYEQWLTCMITATTHVLAKRVVAATLSTERCIILEVASGFMVKKPPWTKWWLLCSKKVGSCAASRRPLFSFLLKTLAYKHLKISTLIVVCEDQSSLDTKCSM
jgi:hypothetical protein